MEDLANGDGDETCQFVITDLQSALASTEEPADVSSTTKDCVAIRNVGDHELVELSALSSFDPFSGISLSTPAK